MTGHGYDGPMDDFDSAGGLAGLLNQATSAVPEVPSIEFNDDVHRQLVDRAYARMQLGDLAPEMAALLIDWAEWTSGLMAEVHLAEKPRALLARFDQLNHKAAP